MTYKTIFTYYAILCIWCNSMLDYALLCICMQDDAYYAYCAILCNIMNSMQYYAILCDSIQYYAYSVLFWSRLIKLF